MKNFLKKLIPIQIKKLIRKIIHYYNRFVVNKRFGSGIKNFKGKYKGKRCFIIGNGPSLKIEDLEKLENEITFSSHLIFKIFSETNWRPTFYCVEDIITLKNNILKISELDNDYTHGFFTGNIWKELPKKFLLNKKNNFWFIDKLYWNDEPDFSFNASKYIAEGLTVTYANIQLAVYMGFSEIYLLGVDHFYEQGNSYSKLIGDKESYIPPQLNKTTISYMKAKKVCDQKGIKIANATRGGHLEVFERVNFDRVLGDNDE